MPPGVVGELWVGGAALALGYIGDPERTEQAFVPDPQAPGERVYRTGDLARMNPEGRFECRWVTLRVESACRSGWLGAIGGMTIRCPVAHGEGRVAVADPSTAARLEDGLVAFRYLADGPRPTSNDPVLAGGVYPANPNGSVNDIAGICDDGGTIVGLMPHPEDHVFDWQRPSGPEGGSGLPLFEAFVAGAR